MATVRGIRRRVLRVADVGPRVLEGMWHLFEATYADVDRGRFEKDLRAKDHILLLQGRGGRVYGFSTVRSAVMRHEGRRFVVLFSGDTVLDPCLWGSRSLQHAFGRHMLRVRMRHPLLPAYWLLVSKGYRTYLLLTRNFPEHWPRHDAPTPAWVRGAIDTACRSWFPEAWRPSEGLLVHPEPKGRLRPGVAAVEDAAPGHADIAFFQRVNPGHVHGDELVCFGRIGWSVWLRYALKPLRRRLRKQAVQPWPS